MVLHKGKSKIVLQGEDENSVILRYTDNITALNGEECEALAGKGELCAAISNLIFAYLEKRGIDTHFLGQFDKTSVRVKKSEIIGVEVIVRNVSAGGFVRKYGIAEGLELEPPVVEFCVKSDELGDPMINESQIIALGLAEQDEIVQLTRQALRVNSFLKSYFKKAKITLIDFKVEFGRYDGKIILCDEISPDSCRLWDMDTGKKLDKDVFRKKLGDVLDGYREVLRRISNVK